MMKFGIVIIVPCCFALFAMPGCSTRDTTVPGKPLKSNLRRQETVSVFIAKDHSMFVNGATVKKRADLPKFLQMYEASEFDEIILRVHPQVSSEMVTSVIEQIRKLGYWRITLLISETMQNKGLNPI